MQKIDEIATFIDHTLNLDGIGKYVPQQRNVDLNQLKNIVIHIGKRFDKKFVLDKENDWYYRNLMYYFTDNEKCVWDLSKGLFVHGGVGRGKSISFDIFEKVTASLIRHKAFQKFSCIDIGLDYADSGSKAIHNVIRLSACFDELGRESASEDRSVIHFGSKIQPMKVVIHKAYEMYKNGKLFHFTCNYFDSKRLSGGWLAETYGAEIRSRIFEMCNIVELTGSDRRYEK